MEIISLRIDELFAKLGASLMVRFTACFGAGKSLMAAKKVWQESLIAFTDDELEQAANDAIDFPSEKIFTLGEFKKMCESVKRRNVRNALPAYGGSSDMTSEQWKHHIKRTYGVDVVLAVTQPRRKANVTVWPI